MYTTVITRCDKMVVIFVHMYLMYTFLFILYMTYTVTLFLYICILCTLFFYSYCI